MSNAPAPKTKTTTPGTLNATSRDTHGKGSARALRRDGKIPGILYGAGQKPVSIALTLNEVTQEYIRGRFRSRLVDIKLDSKTLKALPKELQFNPVSDRIEHVDFIKVEPGMKLHVMVPVHFAGQEKSPGIKRGGVLNIVRHEIEFICLAEAIPQHIDVDVSTMDIGSSVHIKDLVLPKDITPAIKRNFTIATVAGRRAEEEEVKPVVAADAAAAGAEGAAAAAPGAAGAPAAGAPAAGAPAAGAKKDEGKKDEKKK